MADNKTLPLNVRKGFRDFEADKNSNLNKLKAVTGVDWTFDTEIDIGEFYKQVGNRDDLAKVLYKDYLEAVASLFEKKLADSMTKEAFLEAVTARKVAVRLVDSVDWAKHVQIENGQLIIVTSKSDFGAYLSSYTTYKLDTLL